MAKNITKELIIDTTLDLINKKQGSKNINFREIASVLGCAHTNLYNYFPSFDSILWSAAEAAFERLVESVNFGMGDIADTDLKLEKFFSNWIEFYLNNAGWFKLMWYEELPRPRPAENIKRSQELVDVLVSFIKNHYFTLLSEESARYVTHNVHCYLHGEVSIFISGRGLIKDELLFKKYVTSECVKLTKLMTDNIGN